MPSFDIVSEVDAHELGNAVDQANREIGTRFDFKGSNAHIDVTTEAVTLDGENEFQLGQMMDILHKKLVKRNVDISALAEGDIQISGQRAKQVCTIQQGIDKDTGRKITKVMKESKMKIQAAIQGEQVRISGKKRDDLQSAMTLVREMNLELPVQFVNFRD